MKRDVGIDITRIVAFSSVVGVHFFANSGFYHFPVVGKKMFLMITARNMFMVCVPLFLLLTGYLMSGKKYNLDKDYPVHLAKLGKVLFTYIGATLLILGYLIFGRGTEISFKDGVLNILGFSQYSWYVNMYIGLYLLIPFLNLIWNGLETRRARRIIVIVLALMTIPPSIFNIYDLTSMDSFLHPQLATAYTHVVPDWWNNLYPLTYYFIGAYIRKDVDIKRMHTVKMLCIWMVSVLIFGGYNFWRSYAIEFKWGPWCDWYSLQNTVNSVLIFLIINSIQYKKIPEMVKRVLRYISGLTFGAYLLSFIPDSMFYRDMINRYPEMFDRFLRFPMIVGLNICVALFLSWLVHLGVEGITGLINKLRYSKSGTNK